MKKEKRKKKKEKRKSFNINGKNHEKFVNVK
jgi:hypothetical protein